MADVKKQFEAAAAAVLKAKKDPGNDLKLKLYAHYKQATEGDVAGEKPGFTDFVNRAKYDLGRTLGEGARYRQSLAGFSYLLDYVPDWKQIYRPGGLIQHQSFVPSDSAERVFRRQLETCIKRGMPPFLAVLKRHRPDRFLMSHAVDGFSLALDLPVVPRRRDELWALVRELAEPVVEAGGRFYPAKDAALPGELYRASFRGNELDRFRSLKREVDPDHLLRSALADRLLGEPPW